MSDILREVAGIFSKKFRDMGDGSHAEVVSIGGSVPVIGPEVVVDTAMTGQITVTTAGTAVQGPDVDLENGVWIKALAGNSGVVYVGNDGEDDVTSANGFELSAGDAIVIQVSNLSDLWFDAAENGDKFCWMKA
jgi:hypothetical protein